MEANGQAWILLDSKGSILFETGQAVNLLTEYFGHNGSLPSELQHWLKQRLSELKASEHPDLTLEDFSIQSGSTVLTVRLLSPAESTEQRLLLTERDQELRAQPLQALHLTKRQAEVLFWISQGKRNGEIATILETSPSTVKKHVERILSKLGVETRTTAATIAVEVLGRSGIVLKERAPTQSA